MFVGDVVELQKAKVTGLRCGRAFRNLQKPPTDLY